MGHLQVSTILHMTVRDTKVDPADPFNSSFQILTEL